MVKISVKLYVLDFRIPAFSWDFKNLEGAKELFNSWRSVKSLPVKSWINMVMNGEMLHSHRLDADYWSNYYTSSPHWKSAKEIRSLYKQFNLSNFVRSFEEFEDYYTDDKGAFYYNELSVMKEYARLNSPKVQIKEDSYV